MKSYLKFLSRNKLYTAIEAVGLAVSLALSGVILCVESKFYSATKVRLIQKFEAPTFP